MVNFRYHLVTITAIFLALAAGIILGVSVSGQSSSVIQSQLNRVQANVGRSDDENKLLRSELATWNDFGDKAAAGLLSGQLADAPVLLVGVRGVDGKVAKSLRESLTDADATVLGTVWLTAKLKLERPEDVGALATILGVAALDAGQVRTTALSRLARQMASPDRPAAATTTTAVPGEPGAPASTSTSTVATTSTTGVRAAQPTLLSALSKAGFADIEDPAGGTLDPQVLLPQGTRFVVVSADGVDAPDETVAIPFVQALVGASSGELRTVAVEPGRPAKDKDPALRSAFIGPLRATGKEIEGSVSTVNDVEDFRGQAAMVLALADLALGRVGHYGVGPVDRLVPEAG